MNFQYQASGFGKLVSIDRLAIHSVASDRNVKERKEKIINGLWFDGTAAPAKPRLILMAVLTSVTLSSASVLAKLG